MCVSIYITIFSSKGGGPMCPLFFEKCEFETAKVWIWDGIKPRACTFSYILLRRIFPGKMEYCICSKILRHFCPWLSEKIGDFMLVKPTSQNIIHTFPMRCQTTPWQFLDSYVVFNLTPIFPYFSRKRAQKGQRHHENLRHQNNHTAVMTLVVSCS